MSLAKQIEKAIFETARELSDAAARAAFLDQACNGQAGLRQRLDRLLAAQTPADEFFRAIPLREARPGAVPEPASPGAPAASAAPAAGERANDATANTVIGRYRLVQRLGEGGCGVVYLAEQQEPVRRLLALKIIRLGMDTENVIARFKAERQALALMDHPNIAHVLDAGATETGRPYFVMELVQGVKITDFCNQNHLDVPQRLKLFLQVCQAIQHAHVKGVIHRDIKPSNILVTLHDGVPVPKVIDFGIAKATQGRLAGNTFYTARDQFIGTPAYMSPEQASGSGLDVDTRSDVYSLGVLLYELLAGQTPFDSNELAKHGVDELRRTLHEQEPPPPSTLLTTLGDTRLTAVAAQHSAEPPRLLSTLRGDLDWIVMKALEKDRARRYETANGLAMDVQRYLNNEPVVARPPSRLYRFGKLVRRNRVVFAAIAAVTAALLGGLGLSTWLFLKERAAHRRAVEAEQQQFRLRQESDRLRQDAEFRQKLTAATFANSRGKIEEADRLVAGIPAPEPNLEYADLYRALGDWNAAGGRWKQAAERFEVLMQVNQPDDWDVTTLDYLRYGPALLESGDESGYERFRREAVAHFNGTTNPVPAERVVKVSLLTPPSRDLLAALAPLAATASNSLAGAIPDDGWQKSLAAWRSFSLALMDYRQGNYDRVEDWHEKAVAYDKGAEVREATFQIILAMAHYQAGRVGEARAGLARVRPQVERRFDNLAVNSDQAYWFDWVFARILLREATGMIGAGNSQLGP
jgi:serine/threonine protein kinase